MKYYRELQARHIPIICFNTSYPELNVPMVSLDDRKVGYKATKLLIDAGHGRTNRIGAIFKADDGQGPVRYSGYCDALMEAGMHIHPRNVIWIDTMMQQQLEEVGDYVLERLAGCSAVVCYNDDVAQKIIDIALKHGLRVPEDLSVVGIDDANLAATARVPITSFPHPKDELGEKVAENMIQMIENPEFDGNYLFDADVIMRESMRSLR